MSTDHNSNIVGKVLWEYQTLPSTNLKALELIKSGQVEEGMVISAFHQTEGRGQMGATWRSNAGENLTLSIILRPFFLKADEQFFLNKAVSLALHDLVSESIPGAKVTVKWPNDIYVDDRKVAGILIQNILQGGSFQWAVIGIGLNVHQTVFAEDLINPTSLKLEVSRHLELSSIQVKLFTLLDHYYQVIRANKNALDFLYQEQLYKKEVATEFIRNDGTKFWGMIRGVEKSGALLVQDHHDGILTFRTKEISYQ